MTTKQQAAEAKQPTTEQAGVIYERATVARCQDDYQQAQALRTRSADSNRH